MYRASKFGRHIFHPILANIEYSRFNCSLCSKGSYHKIVTGPLFTLTTYYTTRTSAQYVIEQRRKKRNRRNILYTELLEVSEKKTSEKKTKVTTIHANRLLKLDPNLDNSLDRNLTDEIDKNLPIFMNKLGTFTDDGTHEELEEVAVNHDVEIEKPEVIEDPPVKIDLKENKNKKYLSAKNKELLAAIKQGELETAGKEKALNLCLVSYMDLCMSCGFLNRGLATLHFYLKNDQILKISDLRIFNNLMEGCAKKGQIDKLFEVWDLMKTKAGVRPSAKSFACRFEAIARSQKRNKIELINRTLRLMDSEGITLNEMFSRCVWKGSSRETVLGAIRAVRPFFAPHIQPPDVLYSSNLLKHLNKPPDKRLISPAESLLSLEDVKKTFKEQLEMEKKTYIEINSIEKQRELTEEVLFYRKQVEDLKTEWEKNISAALNRDLSAMACIYKSVKKNQGQFNIYPYLVILDKQQYIDIIIKESCRLAEGSETYSLTAASLSKILGMQVKLRYDIKKKSSDGILNKIALLYEEHARWYLNPVTKATNARQNWQLLEHKHLEGPNADVEDHVWPHTVLVGIGRFLYNIILKEIKIDVNIMKQNSTFQHSLPAFYRLFRIQNNVNKEEVKPHPVLSRLLRAARLPQLTFSVTELPMVTPPVPWSSLNTGGYLVLRASLLRLPGQAVQQLERLNEVPPSQLYPCFDSLNQLASIPWKVNKPILDVVIEVFNSGGCLELDIPIPPNSLPLPEMSISMNKTERSQLFKARLLAKRKRAEMFSLWCDALYRLSLANHFRDRIFWLPHNMDFRGRVYPLPPHLSHLGSDMSRSLLVFAKGKPLGPRGLDWLKIHLVNLTGLKKRDSIAERLEYANSILPQILDSANNPLDGKGWWKESEEPWQTLACCLEIRDALRHPGGPEAHISHFPVHQDGSCNGLQHYAALGRDSAGGASVNLSPSPVPQDVYSCVASIVERQRAEDAQRGVLVAQILEGFVRRKVIKQTVMTTVYGVTRYGARLQIAKQLRAIDEFPKEHVWQASHYLVMKTFDSLREMFTSTKEIQDWFTESARIIAKTRGQNLEYVTPLGLPVVQPYSRSAIPSFSEADLRGVVSVNNSYDEFERPNVMKQKNAFPPNFIHSLDSSHMMLTSLHCEREGLTFVSVHDCYWTHPCTVEIMNRICREQFVALHSQPILQDLSNFLIKKYGYTGSESSDSEIVALAKKQLNETLKRVPPKGDFKLENVLESIYFFS